MDQLIKSHFTMIVCGQTGSGKTQFIYSLIKALPQLMVDEESFEKVLYCYGIYQPFYRTIAALPGVELVEGIPKLENTGAKTLMVLDDLFLDTTKEVATIFTRQRHMNLSTIFVAHNFFHECKYMRTVTRNANYLVFFRNPRDMCQIAYLSRQMYPDNRSFLTDAFKQATKKAYGYIFIDLKPTTPEHFRVKSGVLPGEDTAYYVPRS